MSADMWWPEIPVLEKALRPVVVYLFLAAALRLAGKRELAQLTTLDLVVILMLSNTVQNAMIGSDDSLTGGLIGAAALLALNAVLVRVLYGHVRWTRAFEGSPTVLVHGGEVQRRNLKRELITDEELLAAVHAHGLKNLDDVASAILGVDGQIAVIPRDAARPGENVAGRLDAIDEKLVALQRLVQR